MDNQEHRNVSVIKDAEGKKIVMINDIRFKGKKSVDWSDVEEYLRQYVGEFYTIAESKDIVYIGSDLPSEYQGSKYTRSLKGAVAKAKANAAQGIPEMIEIAEHLHYQCMMKMAWYSDIMFFTHPSLYGMLMTENVSVRCDRHKKETSNPLES